MCLECEQHFFIGTNCQQRSQKPSLIACFFSVLLGCAEDVFANQHSHKSCRMRSSSCRIHLYSALHVSWNNSEYISVVLSFIDAM